MQSNSEKKIKIVTYMRVGNNEQLREKESNDEIEY